MTHSSTATAPATIAPAAEPQLRDALRQILDSVPGMSQARIAKEVGNGVSATTLSQWLNGNYLGDNAKIDARIGAWLETFEERRSRSGLPEAPAWVQTSTTDRIEAGLRYAQIAQDIVIIYGGAGVSKTKTCEHYVSLAPGVVMATMSPATKGVPGCLRTIARACGLRDVPHAVPALHDAVVDRLRGTSGLLLIDEAQHLGLEALDEVRSIQDMCCIGLALVGNEYVYTRLADNKRGAFLDRLYSRIGKTVKIDKAKDADIDLLIDAWKINDTKCRAEIREIARRPGALRILTKVLRLAASFAAAKNEAICCDHIKAAWRDLGAFA
jgi:DNA transposition AAA+ family ATPase